MLSIVVCIVRPRSKYSCRNWRSNLQSLILLFLVPKVPQILYQNNKQQSFVLIDEKETVRMTFESNRKIKKIVKFQFSVNNNLLIKANRISMSCDILDHAVNVSIIKAFNE